MSESVVSILSQYNLRKRKSQIVNYTKKCRSKIPRRKRIPILSINEQRENVQKFSTDERALSVFQAISCSSSCLSGETSYTSGKFSSRSEKLRKKDTNTRQNAENISEFQRKRKMITESTMFTDESTKRITRSYYREKENENIGANGIDKKCYLSSNFIEKDSKLKKRSSKIDVEAEEIVENTASEITVLDVSEVVPVKVHNRNFSSEIPDSDVQETTVSESAHSESSCLQSITVEKLQEQSRFHHHSSKNVTKEDKGVSTISEFSDASANFDLCESTAEQRFGKLNFQESDLACSEKIPSEDESDHSTCKLTLSQLESDGYPVNFNEEFEDYYWSSSLESSDNFSDDLHGNSVGSSITYSLFLQWSKQFPKSNSRSEETEILTGVDEEFILLKFEDEEHEESYQNLRNRERRHVVLRNKQDRLGDLVINQRLLMVNWIIEHSDQNERQPETLFLGVSLFDRFLNLQVFNDEKLLQLLGIACLTLATRIEENQPLNSVRRKTFRVGGNVYDRYEVVAMEWLVQEVLNFQCFLPTTYHFLWFYLKAARANEEVESRAKYLAVISLLDHRRLCFWPSTVAAGIVILASLASKQDSSCEWVMETHVRTKGDDLPECIQSLEWLVKYAC